MEDVGELEDYVGVLYQLTNTHWYFFDLDRGCIISIQRSATLPTKYSQGYSVLLIV